MSRSYSGLWSQPAAAATAYLGILGSADDRLLLLLLLLILRRFLDDTQSGSPMSGHRRGRCAGGRCRSPECAAAAAATATDAYLSGERNGRRGKILG